ncbi:MAG: hypothetical protein KIT60_19875 [Burkholderiaceae bacterium]|nr:hypothetical protein [Burkholderiaceae bacterium]
MTCSPKSSASAPPFERSDTAIGHSHANADCQRALALFPEALIEACLAHQKNDQAAAAYNHARLSGPRQVLMQVWADIVECWVRGENARDVIARGKAKIDEAAHDAEGMNL